jgi:hypothetical protein
MPRVQTEYQPSRIGTQVVPVQTVQSAGAHYDPNASTALQLARALGAIDEHAIGTSLTNLQDARDLEEKQQASAYANSMTVEELGHQIKSGDLLPSKSPTLQLPFSTSTVRMSKAHSNETPCPRFNRES